MSGLGMEDDGQKPNVCRICGKPSYITLKITNRQINYSRYMIRYFKTFVGPFLLIGYVLQNISLNCYLLQLSKNLVSD